MTRFEIPPLQRPAEVCLVVGKREGDTARRATSCVGEGARARERESANVAEGNPDGKLTALAFPPSRAGRDPSHAIDSLIRPRPNDNGTLLRERGDGVVERRG